VLDLKDIKNIIVPFFLNYPIIGIKARDFHDWCKVVDMMIKRLHLTPEGLQKIREIVKGMNSKRLI
jgi:hypothetical protein